MAAVAALGEANARYFRTDVTDEDGVVANVAAAKEFLGGLNATITCAGILGAGRVLGREAPMPLTNSSTTAMANPVARSNVPQAAAAPSQHHAARGHGASGALVHTPTP